MSPAPEGYIDVAHRIAAFKAAHPDGSLQRVEWHVETIGDKTFIVYTARAYRDPRDTKPGEGTAWEPWPGPTSFTKDSELMNAETAAWGRAIAALGFEVREGIATAQDVESRTGKKVERSNGARRDAGGPSQKQLDLITRKAKDLGADGSTQELLRAYAAANLTGGKAGTASKAIDALMGEDAAERVLAFEEAADKWERMQDDVPPDTDGLPTQPDEAEQAVGG